MSTRTHPLVPVLAVLRDQGLLVDAHVSIQYDNAGAAQSISVSLPDAVGLKSSLPIRIVNAANNRDADEPTAERKTPLDHMRAHLQDQLAGAELMLSHVEALERQTAAKAEK